MLSLTDKHEALPDCDCHACALSERDRLRAALLTCARQAEALKRDCGMDPESAQAVRNAQYQSISTTAHIALGAITGPAPEASQVLLTDGALLDMAGDFRSQYLHGGVTFDEFDALGFARAVERAISGLVFVGDERRHFICICPDCAKA